MILSKPLLTEILKTSTTILDYQFIDNGNTILYFWKCDSKLWFKKRRRISIFELINKAKEWAFENHYSMLSCKDNNGWTCIMSKNGFDNAPFYASNEFDVIMMACDKIFYDKNLNIKKTFK